MARERTQIELNQLVNVGENVPRTSENPLLIMQLETGMCRM